MNQESELLPSFSIIDTNNAPKSVAWFKDVLTQFGGMDEQSSSFETNEDKQRHSKQSKCQGTGSILALEAILRNVLREAAQAKNSLP
jgi:hypothetical protein